MHTGAGSDAGHLRLCQAARLDAAKVLNPQSVPAPFSSNEPVLVLLAAGKGTRFGQQPKCAQLVRGLPLVRHSIENFRRFRPGPVLCVVGYRSEEVAAAVGEGVICIRSENPTGGTALAVYEAFSVEALELGNPLVIVSMGDRVIPTSIFERLFHTHLGPHGEADLTFLTAFYESPRQRGKGRILRESDGRVRGILEQKDIDAIADEKVRHSLDALLEGNCPLYAARARSLRRWLAGVANDNAQKQFYLTDIIDQVREQGGIIRTVTTTTADPEYDLLCSDVTRPLDLALLEGALAKVEPNGATALGLEPSVGQIRTGRPPGQVASIAEQLLEVSAAARKAGFKPDQPVALGVSGGRLRIAFMHPDMGRFFGPAWQMPIGAADEMGREQIVVLAQASEDRRLHLWPTNPEFQEKISSIPADIDEMYPDAQVADWYSYEGFGTRMAERLLLSLGYFTDEELRARKERGQPLPPSSLWVSTSMRRPFSLIGNAIASLRTVRAGTLGRKVQAALGRESFTGLRLVTAGDIPRGGFSSSSALTVATKNALNALFDLQISPDLLVHLSCQAEYGTGVRAGSLDQATEQKGQVGQGTLLSSNPRDNYRVLGTYPVPAERFHVLFPYSVERDRAAWRWSAGGYAADSGPSRQTTGEMRKMTGKAAEIAAILLELPLDRDFFQPLEADLVRTGNLGPENRRWVTQVLRTLPLCVRQEELQLAVQARRSWLIDQLREYEKLDAPAAAEKADAALTSLFAGWRDPFLRRWVAPGRMVEESGVPLRAMVGYLFAEVVKNFRLIHEPEQWIHWVSLSQRGDRCFDFELDRFPPTSELTREASWEKGAAGPDRLALWVKALGGQPFDFNQGLDDASLSQENGVDLAEVPGTNFFRGLALLDLVEALLKRAFGADAVALRVNAAGQGDFFQVHVDTRRVPVPEVKAFIREAVYGRFGLTPEPDFVEPYPGGGALGLRLDRFDQVEELAKRVRVPDLRWHENAR